MPDETLANNDPLAAPRAKPRAPAKALTIAYPDACGIDIGSRSHFVAVPADRDNEPVREFAAFTEDLSALVQWLRECRVTAVAMESTGVYWIPLYEMLDAAGFEVHLVNARHVKCVPGRKSDVLDCQWLQQLMSFGLLRGAFRPAEEVCALRALWRHRDMLLAYQARHVQHLQKALTQMNVQLHHVITDIMGVTGQAIVRAIGAGERDAQVLAAMRDRRIKADEAEIARALHGNWRDEHLFTLKQALALYDAYAAQIAQCDAEVQRLLGALKAHELPDDGLGKPKRATPAKNAVRFDARGALFEASGVDLTRIPGIDTSTALKVVSKIGVDLERFPSVKHSPHGWACAREPRSPAARCSAAPPGTWPIGPRRRCAWPRRRYERVNRPSAPITAGCARAWIGPRRSPPPRTSWLGWSTSCSPAAKPMWRPGRNTMRSATASGWCRTCQNARTTWVSSSSPPQPQPQPQPPAHRHHATRR